MFAIAGRRVQFSAGAADRVAVLDQNNPDPFRKNVTKKNLLASTLAYIHLQAYSYSTKQQTFRVPFFVPKSPQQTAGLGQPSEEEGDA